MIAINRAEIVAARRSYITSLPRSLYLSRNEDSRQLLPRWPRVHQCIERFLGENKPARGGDLIERAPRAALGAMQFIA